MDNNSAPWRKNQLVFACGNRSHTSMRRKHYACVGNVTANNISAALFTIG
jgi:hypothetical protein